MSNVSRRNFFKGAGAAALVAAAAGSFRAAGTAMKATSPSKTIPPSVRLVRAGLAKPRRSMKPRSPKRSITKSLSWVCAPVACRPYVRRRKWRARAWHRTNEQDRRAPRRLGAVNSRYQLESFSEFPQFEIDKMEIMEDIVRYANGS